MAATTRERDAVQIGETKLQEMVRRIVEAIDPDTIVLFGTRARGEAGMDSDYDLLVIAPSTDRGLDRHRALYRAVGAVGVSKDLLWYTPQEADEWREVRSAFVTTALREGRVVYERAH